LLPSHLQPWASLLRDTWPANAGPMPDHDAVNTACRLLGAFHERSRRPHLAIIMYCRIEGASNAEVRSATGDTWTNKARKLHLDGKLDFMKAKMPGGELRYFIGPPGSHPGPLNAQPFVTRSGGHSEPLNRSTCTSKPVDTVDRNSRFKGELHHGGPLLHGQLLNARIPVKGHKPILPQIGMR
jgi:hypothetical protein